MLNDVRLREHLDEMAPLPLSLGEVRERSDAERTQRLETAMTDSVVFEFEVYKHDKPRRRPLAVAALVVLAVVVAGITLSLVDAGERELTTAATQNAGLPTLPGDLSTATWNEIPGAFPGLQGGTKTDVRSVVTSGDVAWAVGSETSANVGPDVVSRAAVWRSEDGEFWEPVDLGLPTLGSAVPQVQETVFLDSAVTTNNGTIWVFGTDLRLDLRDEANGDFVTSSPIGYRSLDGSSWEPVRPPSAVGVDSVLRSVSSNGNEVLVIVDDIDFDGAGTAEVARTFTTTDGETWTQQGEPLPAGTTQLSLLVNGEVRSVSNSELSDQAALPTLLAAGPELFVVLSEDHGIPDIEIADPANFTPTVQLWLSEDGRTWREQEFPPGENANFHSAGNLFAHDDGVLAVADRNTPHEAILLNVNRSGEAEELGALPAADLADLFVLNDEFFIIGTPSLLEERSTSVWIAEFPANSTETARSGAADRAIG